VKLIEFFTRPLSLNITEMQPNSVAHLILFVRGSPLVRRVFYLLLTSGDSGLDELQYLLEPPNVGFYTSSRGVLGKGVVNIVNLNGVDIKAVGNKE